MKRFMGFFAVLLLSALLVTPAPAAGLRKAAEDAARQAASNHVENFGIFYPPSSWNAKCSRRPGARWKCHVQSEGGQCTGTLRLREQGSGGFKAYHKQIGCGE